MHRISWCVPIFLLAGCSLPEGNTPLSLPPVETVAVAQDDVTMPANPADMEELARTDPIAFLDSAIARYDREVQGYRVLLVKQERIKGKLHPEDQIACSFREKPFSVLMEWKQGIRLARRSLYVEGANRNRIVAQLTGWRALAGLVTCDPHDEDARANSRYPITEFGLRMACRRTLKAWQSARERGQLNITFLGTKKIPELGGRLCWVFRRSETTGHNPEGITRSTYCFDTTTWLQLATVLHDDKDQLIARYHFRDLELNPTFDKDTFTREAMKK